MKRASYLQRNTLKIIITVIILLALLYIAFVWSNTYIKGKLPTKYDEFVEKYADEYGVDKYLVYAVISVESDFDKDAVSSVGACGLMQIMPETAEWMNEKYSLGMENIDLFSPETNIRIGCRYLSYLTERFGNTELAVTAYNGGEGNVSEWLKKYSFDGKTLLNVPYKETANYIKKVNARYEIYSKLYS